MAELKPTSYDALVSPETEDEVLSWLFVELGGLGFNVTSWQDNSVAYAILRVLARGIADLLKVVSALARSAFLDRSSGAWLTLLAAGVYSVTRTPASRARVLVRLTNSGSSAASIAAGSLWLRADTGYRYQSANTGTVTIDPSDTLDVECDAEIAGSAPNVSATSGAPTLTLQTPMTGVTAAFYSVSGTTSPLVSAGADAQSDASLRQQCRDRWATLAGLSGTGGATQAAYRYYVRNAVPAATRVRVSADGSGAVDILAASSSGGIGGSDVTLAQTAVDAVKALTDAVTVASASAQPLTLGGTISYLSDQCAGATEARAFVHARLAALCATIPIGGTVRYSDVVSAIVRPELDLATGTETDRIAYCAVTLAGGTVDVTLDPDEVPTISGTGPTYIGVTEETA